MATTKFPDRIHEVSGNHKVAIDRTADIHKYADEALGYLKRAYENDCAPYVRTGLIRQGDERLETVIRFASCARRELQVAYIPQRNEE